MRKKALGPFVTKMFLVMKFTALLLVLSLQMYANGGHAQDRITLTERNAPLETVLKDIQKITGYQYFLQDKWKAVARRIDISVINATITDVLDICFRNQPFSYAIINQIIVIKERPVAKPDSLIGGPSTSGPTSVTGKVRTEAGAPLSGASVSLRGTKRGDITDKDGNFDLEHVPLGKYTLEISYVGYDPYIEAIDVAGSSPSIVAILRPATNTLDQAQIIAYGTTTQRLSVSNVSSVKGTDIEKQPVSNPLLALEGSVPGLFITQNTGVTNGSVTVRIQGQNSISNGNDPLFIIDGIPYPSQIINVSAENVILGGNSFSFIDPSNIESVSILKDADATAIYGSRAANGAVIITTKRGKAGRTKVDVNVQEGWGKVAHEFKMLNTQQYLEMRHEAFRNDQIDWTSPDIVDADLKVWDTTRYTNWQKTLIGGTAQYSNFNVGISGGTSATQYLVGGTFHRETTVYPSSPSDKKGGVHFNLNSASPDERIHFQVSGSYMYDDDHLPQTDLTQEALLLEPDAPSLRNLDGTLNWAPDINGNSTWINPLSAILYNTYQNTTKNLLSHTLIRYIILPGLELMASAGYTNLSSSTYSQFPLSGMRPEYRASNPSSAYYGNLDMTSWIVEPQAAYNKMIGDGKLEALLGSTIQYNTTKSVLNNGQGYSSDLLLADPASAASVSTVSSGFTEYKYNAIFGRLNYIWKGKYVITGTGRRDGSSRFGKNNRFHDFGSLGGGWVFSEEKVIKKGLPFLSFGKIRASYGTTGSDQISDYSYLSLYFANSNGVVPYQNTTGLALFLPPNPYLQWEETRKWQFGADFGALKDRVLLSVTYARNRSSNQLLGYKLPTITGFGTISENFPATVQNTSWEFLLNTKNIQGKAFSWSSSVNLTIPRNKLVAFPNLANSTYASSLVVGSPIGIQKAYRFIGVDPASGLYSVNDSHGTPTTTPNPATDLTAINSTLPKFYGGFENSLRFKSIQLNFLLQFVKQDGVNNYYWNGTVGPGTFYSGYSNQPATVLNRWQHPGDIRPIQAFGTSVYSILPPFSNVAISDAASFLRLKNLSLNWQIPEQWLRRVNIQSCQIYARAQNLLTITRFRGLDPENQSLSYLPPLRMLTMGIQMSL